VDADLPGGGIDAAAEIVSSLPGTVVVMLGAAADEEQVLAAIRAGARGYLPRDMDPARLPAALRGAVDGEAALPRALMGKVLDELHAHGRFSTALASLGAQLTRREQEVLELLDRELDTVGIARALEISPVTVRRHVSEVLRKLGVSDRGAALALLRSSV
jgi:DNA-binding NarL/FixJ family response regulator